MAPVSHDLSTEREIRETDKDTHVVVLITARAARVRILSKKKEKLLKTGLQSLDSDYQWLSCVSRDC